MEWKGRGGDLTRPPPSRVPFQIETPPMRLKLSPVPAPNHFTSLDEPKSDPRTTVKKENASRSSSPPRLLPALAPIHHVAITSIVSPPFATVPYLSPPSLPSANFLCSLTPLAPSAPPPRRLASTRTCLQNNKSTSCSSVCSKRPPNSSHVRKSSPMVEMSWRREERVSSRLERSEGGREGRRRGG